jgi:hypothetical protein
MHVFIFTFNNNSIIGSKTLLIEIKGWIMERKPIITSQAYALQFQFCAYNIYSTKEFLHVCNKNSPTF